MLLLGTCPPPILSGPCLPAFEKGRKRLGNDALRAGCSDTPTGTRVALEPPSLLSLCVLKSDPSKLVLRSLECRCQVTVSHKGPRARRVCPALQRSVASVPAPKLWHPLSSYISVPGKSSPPPDQQRRGTHRAQAVPMPARQLVPHGGPGGGLGDHLGISGKNILQALLQRWMSTRVQEPHARMPTSKHPTQPGAPGNSARPFQRLQGPFHKDGRKMQAQLLGAYPSRAEKGE